MIPIRQNRVRVVDRIRRIPLGEPVSLSLTMDEEWSPRTQGEIVVGDDILTELTRPGGDPKLGQLQADYLELELETVYRECFELAALTAKVKGQVKAATSAWKGNLKAVTAAFARPWNPGERIQPLSAATANWGGKPAAVTTALSPRVDAAEITAELRVRGGSYLIPPTDRMNVSLRIRSRTPNLLAGTTTLSVASEDVRLHDYRRTDPTIWVNPHSSLRDLATWVLDEVAVPATLGSTIRLEPGLDVRIEASQEWTPGESAWEFIHPILETVAWALYADETGTYRLEPRTPTPAVVELSPDQNLLKYAYTEDRAGDWYDGAVIEYTEADPLDPSKRYDVYASMATRIAHETRPGWRTMPGAAQALVERSQTRCRTGTASSLALLPLRAGQRVPIAMGAIEAQGEPYPYYHYGTIRSLSLRLPDGEMDLSFQDITI